MSRSDARSPQCPGQEAAGFSGKPGAIARLAWVNRDGGGGVLEFCQQNTLYLGDFTVRLESDRADCGGGDRGWARPTAGRTPRDALPHPGKVALTRSVKFHGGSGHG